MKILIVDDQDILRRSVIIHLQYIFSDAEIMECKLSEESLAMTIAFKPDIIFMDVSMPGISGMQATRQILSVFPHQQVIAFSMNDTIEMVHKMLEAGAMAYLLKTDSMEDFRTAVNEVQAGRVFISKNVVPAEE